MLLNDVSYEASLSMLPGPAAYERSVTGADASSCEAANLGN